MTFNPDMLILAREAEPMTQKELAEATGITQSLISKYESGVAVPTPNGIAALARALGVREGFFAFAEKRYQFGSSCTYHRRQQSLQAKQLSKLLADLNILRLHVARMASSIDIETDITIPRMDLEDYDGDVRAIAANARMALQIPPGPIPSMIGVLESAGVIVVNRSFETRKLDAVSQWVAPLPPVFMLNSDTPVDRQRFTLAHELGHLIMHQSPTGNMEAEADAFAAEFLMPADDIRPHLEGLKPGRLAGLKLVWRVSMAALTRRARDLGCITDSQYTAIYKLLSQQGYRTREPDVLLPEEPTLYRGLIEAHAKELGYSTEDFCGLFGFEKPKLYVVHGIGRPSLRIAS